MKFLCDQMLGTLAKWLRLFGFDVFYSNDRLSDDELIKIAVKEKMTIISRDKELIKRSEKQNLTTIFIKTIVLDEQLVKVASISPIEEKKILTRCNLCNTIIENIDKSDVEGSVPIKVFENNDEFWYCKKCKKYYWRGTHYDKIIKKYIDLKKKHQ